MSKKTTVWHIEIIPTDKKAEVQHAYYGGRKALYDDNAAKIPASKSTLDKWDWTEKWKGSTAEATVIIRKGVLLKAGDVGRG